MRLWGQEMQKHNFGVFLAVLLFAALACGQEAGQIFSAYNIEATSSFLGTDWFVPNPGNTHNTHIHMENGVIRLAGGDGPKAFQPSSWAIPPDIQLQPYQGTAAWGHFTIENYGSGPGLDLGYCTGLNNPAGFQHGCDIANGSSDSVGEIWLTGGALGGASKGTVEVVFGGTPWPSTPYCQLTLQDEGAAWAPGATVRAIVPRGGWTRQQALALTWDNNGVNMPDGKGGPGVGILYFCVAAP